MVVSLPAEGLATQPNGLREGRWSPPPPLMEAASGDDELIADLIDAFTTDTVARLLQIRTALANSDFPKMRAEAHTIKGAARQVGAEAVGDACQELEAASDLLDVTLAAARLNRVQEFFEVVYREMTSYSARRTKDQTVQPSI